MRLPTEGETRAAGRSGLKELLFCVLVTGSQVLSAQTASTMESTLEERGRRAETLSLLKEEKTKKNSEYREFLQKMERD